MTTGEQTENDRMHSYLASQGERYSFSDLWPRVCKARLDLLDALAGVSDEQVAFVPEPGEWSIRETAHHILNSSRNVRRLVIALATGLDPDASGVELPPSESRATAKEVHDDLLEDGIAWTSAIAELDPTPEVSPVALHPMFGELHSRAWYLFQRVHDIDHTQQIQAVKAVPGYPDGAASR